MAGRGVLSGQENEGGRTGCERHSCGETWLQEVGAAGDALNSESLRLYLKNEMEMTQCKLWLCKEVPSTLFDEMCAVMQIYWAAPPAGSKIVPVV